ncbi:MAG: hypothetical protein FJ145_18505 [Deltaproteobacteria bacterium]|nr:hypothetical protein [Deltaproteobacteria bacterium]
MKNPYFANDSAVLEQPLAHRPEWPRREVVASHRPSGSLPFLDNLGELLGVNDVAALQDILDRALFGPVAEATAHPGKRIRAQLVSLCYQLVNTASPSVAQDAAYCRRAAEVVEVIHLGSLIVDDIEDGSLVRRGHPALHVRHGVPLALNAGNWLYFWSADLIRRLDLPESAKLLVYELYHRTMSRAHLGQAADLGCRANTLAQSAVAPACLGTVELKTGALMGFAAALGGAAAAAPVRMVRLLDEFGKRLGVALQMFDDMGNVIGRCEPAKRCEDLLMKRLCWVWACAATLSPAKEYQAFVAAVQALPESAALNDWMTRYELIPYVRQSARGHLDAAFRFLEAGLKDAPQAWSKPALEQLRHLGEEIAVAYD